MAHVKQEGGGMWLIPFVIPLRKWNDIGLKTLVSFNQWRKSLKLERPEALSSNWPITSCFHFSHASVIIVSALKTKGLISRLWLFRVACSSVFENNTCIFFCPCIVWTPIFDRGGQKKKNPDISIYCDIYCRDTIYRLQI